MPLPSKQCSVHLQNLLLRQVFSQRSVPGGRHQNCRHHSSRSIADWHSTLDQGNQLFLVPHWIYGLNRLRLVWKAQNLTLLLSC
uniref:Uncharacterized protein n=1 Tax=Rhizophora mucronata TaxID=61149 RepID=A0A2P2J758_RHIMU